MSETEQFVPKVVRALAEEITQHTGVAPTIEHVDSRRIRIVHGNHRIRMTVDHKMTGTRWVWTSSTLIVDGERSPIMDSRAAYYRLFSEPENGGKLPAEPFEPLEPYPLEDAPPELQPLVDRMAKVEGATVVFGKLDGAPAVDITTDREVDGKRSVRLLRVAFRKKGELHLRLTIDGFDETDAIDSTLEGAFALLLGERGVPAPMQPGSPVRGQHAAERTNSVEVRRQTVIRV